MTIERVTLEWRFVQIGADLVGHLALVARESGQSDGQGYVISGNPSKYGSENPSSGDYGYLQANLGNGTGGDLEDSVDAYPVGTTESDRHAVDISSALLSAGGGRTLDQIWADMCSLGDQIDAQQFTYDPSKGAPPTGVTANSNSFINSVLSLIGVEASDHYGGTLPAFGFPGDQTILSGVGDDFMRGFSGNDTFLNAGGGYDIFHGGDGTSLVRSDGSDGFDRVGYDGFDYVTINTASDLSSWQAIQKKGMVTYTDTLYSIEAFGSKDFLLQNEINFSNEIEGKVFEDKSPADLMAEDGEFSDAQTLVQVEVDSIYVNFTNFGTIVATDYADSFVLNQQVGRIFDGGGGTDKVSYDGVIRNGLKFAIDGAGDVEVGRHSVPIAALGSLEGLLPPKDTLENVEHILGTQQSDIFSLVASSDKLLDADSNLAYSYFNPSQVVGNVAVYQPTGNPYGQPFYTNMAWDTLDLSQVTDDMTVQRGGATVSGSFPVTITSGTTKEILLTFEDDTEMTTRGMESVKLGGGDDLLIVGRVVVSGGTESLYTEFDMGGGTDTVQVWGDAVLKDGKIYTKDGSVVSGFEEIEIPTYNGSVLPEWQRTLLTYELGHDYVTNSTLNWVDYSGINESLTFTLGGSGGSVAGASASDTYTGRFNVAGTDNGDTFYMSSGYGRTEMGTGNDTVYISGSSSPSPGGFFFSGGDDVFHTSGSSFKAAINTDVSLSSVTVSHENATIIESTTHYAVYLADVVVDVDTQGSMTFVDSLYWYRYSGSDGILFTGDDFYTNYTALVSVNFQDEGTINVREEGVAYIYGSSTLEIPYRNDFSDPDVTGTSGNDTIRTESFEDVSVHAGAGNDDVVGGLGNDTLYGEGGHDYIRGGAGNDIIYGGSGNDILSGDAGDDTLDGGTGEDVLIGGSGKDTFIIDGVDTVYDYRLEDGDIIDASGLNGNTLTSYETGGFIVVSDGTNNFRFMDLFDRLQSDGDVAKDVMVELSTGSKVVQFDNEGGIVAIRDGATSGNDTLSGTSGDDIIFGFDGADSISGLAGNDHLIGGDGNDTLNGGDGNDILEGGLGNDTLWGGDGDDVLMGYGGSDALWGEDGADVFGFLAEDVGNGVDTLHDFDISEEDVIDISDILTGYDPMVDALADFVQFTNAGSHANLSVDIDGAGTTYGWTHIATVYNHNDLDPTTLVSNGNLVVA